MKRGLVLEGGGAKGAYQAGAIKALNKRGIYFDGVCGTSIGSINAAFYACRNFNALYKLWQGTDSEYLFGVEDELLENITHGNISINDLKKGFDSAVKIIKNNGIDTSNMRKILTKNISEDKIRRYCIDFGLTTYNITDRKPIQIYINDIPQGKLIDYVLASSYLPFFKFEKIIDNKYYLDGGVFSNCPIDMFLDKDYDEIYAIKAWQSKLKYKTKKGVKVNVITPSENLGSIMIFNHDMGKYRMDLGYYDTIKFLDKLDGSKYYFKTYSESYYNHLFTPQMLKKMIKTYSSAITIKTNKTFIIRIIEKSCIELHINRFKVYDMPYLITKLKYKMVSQKNSIYYDFIKNIKVEFE